jgi:hypothetical protein
MYFEEVFRYPKGGFMNTSTGDMVTYGQLETIKKENPQAARFFKKIPDVMFPEIDGMNRQGRRQWYRKNKKRIAEATTNA